MLPERLNLSAKSRLRMSAADMRMALLKGTAPTVVNLCQVGKGGFELSELSTGHFVRGRRNSAFGVLDENISLSQTWTIMSGPKRMSTGNISWNSKVS
mmetsp:Transcript_27749/g.83477  ORF Transcript_27749/g.83477 Transcript_27749/m.83477 type:complete len:98 (-) Transcript_27749:3088-3381(-)